MDSLSQLALGAAVAVSVMGRRTALWKAALWGGIAGTLPDLDVFIDHGDAVRNMTLHRAETHALFYLTLFSPLIAWLASRLHGQADQFRRWWLAMWLALVTHPLLDSLTIYGTQLLLPFTDRPFGVGSMFIIDPLYTLPLLAGVIIALVLRGERGLRWNHGALALSCAYLAWSVLAQWHVRGVAEAALTARGGPAPTRVLVTPAPLNTLLWRVVAMHDNGYEEGFYSLLDRGRTIRFDRFTHDAALYRTLQDRWPVQRIAWFSRGFFKMEERDGAAIITDLRMGQEPNYTFAFRVAQRQSPTWGDVTPQNVGQRGDIGAGLAWLGPRIRGQDIPPPR